ncbi:phosphoadenosine phosphosulfate reductase [Capnocytophaga canimorsus]|uniref:phosphoadenosine phosphosulfate reductase n=1 Tax=Capnocytophaga canimorsus TaxID=28188 RepID=UPI0037D90341
MEKNIMVTVSGGRSSAFMARHIQTSEKYKDYNKIYVFANTGMERPETIDFLRNIEKHWGIELIKIEGVYSEIMGVGVGYNIVDWNELNMNCKPFEEAIKHKNKGTFDGLPHDKAPYCSGMLKSLPCEKLCDDIFGKNNYIKAIGYRKEDMPKRITLPEIKEDKKRIYPLFTDFETIVGQRELNYFWNEQPFKLEIHNKYGNCCLCWKKSDHNLLENIRKGTSHIDWVRKMEKKYGNTSFRGELSIDDLVRMASLPTTMEIEFPDDDDDYNCVCTF